MFNFILLFIIINLCIFYFIDKLIAVYNLYDFPDNKRKIHKKKRQLLED